ncbi:hypothetical protein Tco_0039145 [Tanacetum coccineum]
MDLKRNGKSEKGRYRKDLIPKRVQWIENKAKTVIFGTAMHIIIETMHNAPGKGLSLRVSSGTSRVRVPALAGLRYISQMLRGTTQMVRGVINAQVAANHWLYEVTGGRRVARLANRRLPHVQEDGYCSCHRGIPRLLEGCVSANDWLKIIIVARKNALK